MFRTILKQSNIPFISLNPVNLSGIEKVIREGPEVLRFKGSNHSTQRTPVLQMTQIQSVNTCCTSAICVLFKVPKLKCSGILKFWLLLGITVKYLQTNDHQ
jgi:hypothetical protein